MATIRQSIEVNAPVHALYNQLACFEDYPRFMEEIESVIQTDETHLHWSARADDRPLEWDAEIDEREEDRCIAWHSTNEPLNTGRMEMQEAGPDSSRLTITLQAEVDQQAWSQQELEQQVQRNLTRLKSMVEAGEAGDIDSSYAAGSEGLSVEEVMTEPAVSFQSSQQQITQTVAAVMTRDAVFVSPQESLQRAAQLMDELNVGALPVCEGGRLIGMVTDRDITVRGTAAGKAPAKTVVEEVMSADVRYCFENQSLDEVMQQMADAQIRRMPVVSQDKTHKLIGIVSLGDLVTKSTKKHGVEALVEKIASPSEPDRLPSAR